MVYLFSNEFDYLMLIQMSEKLQIVENENTDAMFVFMSDVWLDEPDVQSRLRRLFAGYENIPPTMFVFCGNFITHSQSGVQYNNSLKVPFVL